MYSRICSFVECGHRASKHVYGHNSDRWDKGDWYENVMLYFRKKLLFLKCSDGWICLFFISVFLSMLQKYFIKWNTFIQQFLLFNVSSGHIFTRALLCMCVVLLAHTWIILLVEEDKCSCVVIIFQQTTSNRVKETSDNCLNLQLCPGAYWGQNAALEFLAQSGPPNPVFSHSTKNDWHNPLHYNLCFVVYMANSK